MQENMCQRTRLEKDIYIVNNVGKQNTKSQTRDKKKQAQDQDQGYGKVINTRNIILG